MKSAKHVLTLTQIGSLHYEKLHGDKEGLSSVRVNNQYRIEFEETKQNGEDISTICNYCCPVKLRFRDFSSRNPSKYGT